MQAEDTSADALARIEARLDRLERSVDRLVGALDSALPLTAMAADIADEEAARVAATGANVDDRAAAAIGVVERLTEPATAAALGRLLDRAEALEAHVASLPGNVAMGLDVIDEVAGRLAAGGADVDARLRSLSDLLLRLSEPATAASMCTLLDLADQWSGVLATAPETTAMVMDTLDDELDRLRRAGTDPDGMVRSLFTVATMAGDPAVAELLATVRDAAPVLRGAIEVAGRAPDTTAMVLDIVDDLLAAASQEGVDLGLLAPRLYDASKAGVAFLTSDGFHAFMEAMAEPEAFAHLVPIIRSIREATATENEPISAFQMLLRMRDERVQRALGLTWTFLAAIGRTHEEHHGLAGRGRPSLEVR